MFLKHIASTDYGLIHGSWQIEHAFEYLETLRPKLVLVAMDESGRCYCSFLFLEIMSRLFSHKLGTVKEALGPEALIMPVGFEYDDAETAPDQMIVLDRQGRLLGYTDSQMAPQERVRGTSPGDHQIISPFRLRTEYPAEVLLGESFELISSLEQVMSGEADVTLIPGAEIKLSISVKEGLCLLGASEFSLTLPKIEDTARKTPDVRFELMSVKPGVGFFYLLLTANNTVRWFPFECQILKHRLPRPDLTKKTSKIFATSVKPDLTLVITSESKNNQWAMTIVPTTQLHDPEMRACYKTTDMDMHYRNQIPNQYLEYIEGIRTDMEPQVWAATRKRLENACVSLTELLVPESLLQRLWHLQDHISTVFIRTGELDLPWELCRLTSRGTDRAFYFSEKWGLTRWDLDVEPTLDLCLDNLALLTPSNCGEGAVQEAEQLEAIFEKRLHRLDMPKYMDVYNSLLEDCYHAWHFCGHFRNSNVNDFSSLILDDDCPFHQVDLSTIYFNFTKPLIFLNGCRSARISAGGNQSWAKQFIKMGAAAFIGSHWNIKNFYPSYFSTAFYKSLLKGQTISEAVLAARKATRDQTGESTWLSYCVYAHPMAKVKGPSMESSLFPDE